MSCLDEAEKVAASEPPPRLWRNGMDYEPKRVGPPDYSNVPDVRSWQMSPFSHERFDLDEIQRAEKLGYKYKGEVERLKKLYGLGGGQKEEKEKEEKERKAGEPEKKKCTWEYMYQPYGPTTVSSLSYSRPESGRPRMYSYMGPSIFTDFRSGRPAPVPCEGIDEAPRTRNFRNVYVPLGSFVEIRLTGDQYVPLGPPMNPSFK